MDKHHLHRYPHNNNNNNHHHHHQQQECKRPATNKSSLPSTSASPSPSSSLIYVFYDNSNIWIEGKKFHQKSLSLVEDKTWRFSAAGFLKLAKSFYNGEIEWACCYGSRPPPIDDVWDIFRKVIK
jgi:hypothetical protein